MSTGIDGHGRVVAARVPVERVLRLAPEAVVVGKEAVELVRLRARRARLLEARQAEVLEVARATPEHTACEHV